MHQPKQGDHIRVVIEGDVTAVNHTGSAFYEVAGAVTVYPGPHVKDVELVTPPEPRWTTGDVITTPYDYAGERVHVLFRGNGSWRCNCLSTGSSESDAFVSAYWQSGRVKVLVKDGKVL